VTLAEAYFGRKFKKEQTRNNVLFPTLTVLISWVERLVYLAGIKQFMLTKSPKLSHR